VSRRPQPPALAELVADGAFVARLLMGAQTEHEQRLTVVRLLRRDEQFRAEMAASLGSLRALDADLAAEYGQALREAGADVAARRREILERAYARAPDLDQMLVDFTYSDLLCRRNVRIFTWSMAERLLERSCRPGLSEYEVKSSLYLALMVIDAVEILGAAGHGPDLPEVVADVRRRITKAAAAGDGRQAVPSRKRASRGFWEG
jgi:hypothetical protein